MSKGMITLKMDMCGFRMYISRAYEMARCFHADFNAPDIEI